MIKKKKIKIPIFPCEVVVILTNDLQEYAKHLGEEIAEEYAAFVLPVDGLIFAVFDTSFLTFKNIAHETVHIVNFIFKQTGIQLDIDNDETQAYLTGFIFEQIINIIKNHGYDLSIL